MMLGWAATAIHVAVATMVVTMRFVLFRMRIILYYIIRCRFVNAAKIPINAGMGKRAMVFCHKKVGKNNKNYIFNPKIFT